MEPSTPVCASTVSAVRTLRAFGVRAFTSLIYAHKPDMAAWLNQWAVGFAEATPDCSRFAIEAIWVMGWVNIREYWMKACTSPSRSCPLATMRPPSTAMTT